MQPAGFGLVVIFLVVGCLLGWHASRAHAAHDDVKTTRGRLPGYRKTRLRSGLIVLGLLALVLLVATDLMRG